MHTVNVDVEDMAGCLGCCLEDTFKLLYISYENKTGRKVLSKVFVDEKVDPMC